MTDTSKATQPCASCDRETRPGTALFSDRRVVDGDDGTVIHFCGDCNERAVSHYGRQPSDKEMTQIAARAAGWGG